MLELVVLHKNGNVAYLNDGRILKNIALDDLPDNTNVLDLRDIMDTKDGIYMMICSPTVDVRLKKGEIYYCPTVSENAIETLMSFEQKLQQLQKIMRKNGIVGPLDIISKDQYIENWCSIGAKLGVVRNSFIEWQN